MSASQGIFIVLAREVRRFKIMHCTKARRALTEYRRKASAAVVS
jgi:hypothetical protein